MKSSKKIPTLVIDNKYNVVKQLGKGSFGEIYSAKALNSETMVAIKLVDIKRNHPKVKCQINY